MTQEEWLVTEDWLEMFRHLGNMDGSRKLRLWCVAWVRLILKLAEDAQSRLTFATASGFFTQPYIDSYSQMADAGEMLADRLITRKAIHSHKKTSGGPYNLFYLPLGISRLTVDGIYNSLRYFTPEFKTPTPTQLASLLRDIFPFGPVTLLPEWRTSTVLALATGIYNERAFDRMPILADALMDSGCDNEEILNHCRGPGPHCRGCWVCDLCLGKQ